MMKDKKWLIALHLLGFLICIGIFAYPHLKSKKQLINYWAEWCAPCIEEIEELNCIFHNEDEIEVIGVYWGGTASTYEEMQVLAKKFNIAYRIELPDFHDEIKELEQPEALPMTVLLNKKKQVEHVFYGAQTVEDFQKHLPELSLETKNCSVSP